MIFPWGRSTPHVQFVSSAWAYLLCGPLLVYKKLGHSMRLVRGNFTRFERDTEIVPRRENTRSTFDDCLFWTRDARLWRSETTNYDRPQKYTLVCLIFIFVALCDFGSKCAKWTEEQRTKFCRLQREPLIVFLRFAPVLGPYTNVIQGKVFLYRQNLGNCSVKRWPVSQNGNYLQVGILSEWAERMADR